MPKNDPYGKFNRRVNAANAVKGKTKIKVLLNANEIYKSVTDKLKF